jgi:BMFP domain-containing protein YqiC
VSKASDLIEEYLSVGGLFNPEIMNQNQHDAVRDTLIIARDEIRGLEDRIKRLEEAGDLMVQHFYTDEPRSEMWEKAKEAKP